MNGKFGYWSAIMFSVALGKAAVAGAGLGLAVFGATDLFLSIPFIDVLDGFSKQYEAFAAVGAVLGVVGQIVFRA